MLVVVAMCGGGLAELLLLLLLPAGCACACGCASSSSPLSDSMSTSYASSFLSSGHTQPAALSCAARNRSLAVWHVQPRSGSAAQTRDAGAGAGAAAHWVSVHSMWIGSGQHLHPARMTWRPLEGQEEEEEEEEGSVKKGSSLLQRYCVAHWWRAPWQLGSSQLGLGAAGHCWMSARRSGGGGGGGVAILSSVWAASLFWVLCVPSARAIHRLRV